MALAAVRSKVVIMLLFIHCLLLLPFSSVFVGGGGRGCCVWSLCFGLALRILSSFTIILLKKNELVALLKIQSELPRPIPWNHTSDVHRGSTLIT